MGLKKLATKDICLIGLFTALTAILAQISIPTPFGVPFTLQTFAVAITGVTLGAKRGFFSAMAYVLVGAVGMPVFANANGGFGILLGPTGGFIASFPVMTLLIGLGSDKGGKYVALGIAAATVANYALGVAVFSIVTGSGIKTAFIACVLNFIVFDIIKSTVAGVVGIKVRQRVLYLRTAS
jgi:biotin transport system substrate-specific component